MEDRVSLLAPSKSHHLPALHLEAFNAAVLSFLAVGGSEQGKVLPPDPHFRCAWRVYCSRPSSPLSLPVFDDAQCSIPGIGSAGADDAEALGPCPRAMPPSVGARRTHGDLGWLSAGIVGPRALRFASHQNETPNSCGAGYKVVLSLLPGSTRTRCRSGLWRTPLFRPNEERPIDQRRVRALHSPFHRHADFRCPTRSHPLLFHLRPTRTAGCSSARRRPMRCCASVSG